MNATRWHSKKIGQLGRVVTGKTPPTKQPELYGDVYPFITPTDISENLYSVETARFLSQEGFEYQSNLLIPPKSVCYTCIASIGKICLTATPSFTNQQINTIIVNHDEYDYRFVYYLLIYETERIKKYAGGAAAPIINKSAFSDIDVTVPELPIQRRIADILSAYDDLIENNTRRIHILEQIAQAIYQEWFGNVDKESMPVGWEMATIENYGDVITGKTPSKAVDNYWNSRDVPFIRTPDMHNQFYCIETTDYMSTEGANSQTNAFIPPNSLCVSCIGTVGIVTITPVRAQTNQQINSVVLNDLSDLEFLYFELMGLKETLQNYAAVGATMANLSKGKFMSVNVQCPPKELREKFHLATSTMFEQIKNFQYKNANLRQTRDLLLTRLVNGEIEISELSDN